MPTKPSAPLYTQRLQRLLTLVNEIKTNPRQTPQKLCASLGISQATFFADRQTLVAMGFVFRYERKQRQYIIQREPFLPVLNLSTGELFALILAVRQLSATGEYLLTYEAIAALKKIVANAPTEIRAFLLASIDTDMLQGGFGCQAEIVDDLWRACQERRRLRIVHESGQGEQTWIIDPYQLLFKRRALYLDAYVVEEKHLRMFRVNRIRQVSVLNIPPIPTPLAEYNARERHRHSFSVFVGEKIQRVRLRCRPEVRQYITETRWHSSQQIETAADGTFVVQFEVSEPREVGWWALQWGASVEVLEPESLRDEMRRTVQALSHLYK